MSAEHNLLISNGRRDDYYRITNGGYFAPFANMTLILEEILDRVRGSDLEHFKEKITKMEEDQATRLHSQNLENIDDITKRKFLNKTEELDAMYVDVDATPLKENVVSVPEGEQNSDTLYQNFLKKLKG